ncbi:MAG: MerR family transcriptional regulator [Candidatus Kapaibacterium sp.]|jgi:DNA-binding transcriptional MerR regulator|nr:MerR family transcriptional regulator [Ignavibacteria bacterium]MBN8574601.1 MerR family transcriptional regulator [Candidatus Kapabacteria bacterium]HRE57492.1 MerR family transcriptional regulator [Candidatus Kapabacteria bacterium]
MFEPTKKYFSISEVGKLIDEQQHVLRYWEREFGELRPKKNSAGNRIYTQKDLDLLKVIKIMLRKKRLSVIDAKLQLKSTDINEFLAQNPFDFMTAASDTQEETQANTDTHGSAHDGTNNDDSVRIPRAEFKAIYAMLKDIEQLLRTV